MASRHDIDHLAELIAESKRDAALRLLKDMHPDKAPWPLHVPRRVADRRAEPAGRAT
ncbi:hypothetical protein [Aureimonas sp. SK2]|uniref:hypothetical protein n=1 Tax=Aureimonas sp. SK2 TaxID=3015992 RepID=UPI00244460EB|nr:hypothetical protein [Aureimonas sp. SK2]